MIPISVLFFILIVATAYAKTGFGPGEQEWDFELVRPGGHMFWWLYYTTANVTKPEQKPLVIWLQGGPCVSSTGFGNFNEVGPLNLNLTARHHTWVKDYNVMFIDNPLGAGFSHFTNGAGFSTNNSQIAKDLVECLRSFYTKFPQFTDTPLYITGESYGGKMIIEFALNLNKEIVEEKIKANLKGVALIDSWISPVDSSLNYADYGLSFGLLNADAYEEIKNYGEEIQQELLKKEYLKAFGTSSKQSGAIQTATYGVDVYNILNKISHTKNAFLGRNMYLPLVKNIGDNDLSDLMNNDVKKALNIPEEIKWTDLNIPCYYALSTDFMRDVTDIVEEVLNTTNIKVFVINGQLDLIVPTPGTYAWIKKLKFNNKTAWNQAPRMPFTVDGYIEGYVKSIDNFAFYWVDRAGHMVPADNPPAMSEILTHLIGK